MTKINLELQLKFLTQLENALAGAMDKYSEEGEDRRAELAYMQREVDRARRIVSGRLVEAPARKKHASSFREEEFPHTLHA